MRKSKKLFLFTIAFLIIWALLARYVIFQNRWSDSKAQRIFQHRNVPLIIKDTLIGERTIHYAIAGDNNTLPLLLFIHGSPGSWMNFSSYMSDEKLLQKFRIASIDRPGFGHSNYRQPLNLKEQCSILLPVIKQLKQNSTLYICGHSMGTPVALQLAAMDTSLFTTLLLSGTAIDIAEEKKENWRTIMAHPLLYWALPGAYAPSNTELLYLKKDLQHFKDELNKVTAEVRFVHGKNDKWVPIENLQLGFDELKNARRVTADTIINAGHQLPWTHQELFKEKLVQLY